MILFRNIYVKKMHFLNSFFLEFKNNNAKIYMHIYMQSFANLRMLIVISLKLQRWA